MTDSGNSSGIVIKEEPIDVPTDLAPEGKPEGKSVAKLIERIRLVEKERDSAQSQLLEIIGKYTESEQKNSFMEEKSRQAAESAARRISLLERRETEKVIEWVNKYKRELAKNHSNEKKASEAAEEVDRLKRELQDVKAELERNHYDEKISNRSSDEVERLRRELEDVQKQLEIVRNAKEGNDKNSKMILKSNMDLASQVAQLKQVKVGLDDDMRKMMLVAKSLEHNVTEERTKAMESEARAAQCEKNLVAYKAKINDDVDLLKKVIETADRERLEAQAEAAEIRKAQAKLKIDHDEMREINGFLATTASGKIYEELAKARKHIENLEKKVSGRPFDPRLESTQPKKRKTV